MNHRLRRLWGLLLLFPASMCWAQQEANNQLDVNLQMLGHGEMRFGGLDDNTTESESGATDKNHAYFLMGRTRLSIDYKRMGLETKVVAQHSGVWGQKGQGNFNLYEAWAKFNLKNGLFGQIGRQALAYDDERIIGTNDWAMAALSHDVIRLGYDGPQHKAHAIFAFNQNAENTHGGTYYKDGAQPYKTMQTFWYHFDVPKFPLGASLLFMNIGMQGGTKEGYGDDEPRTIYQQLLGTYIKFSPGRFSAEASYYHQLGRSEDNLKINAWMASVRGSMQVIRQLKAVAGFDYLSGDKYFAVPAKGHFGVTRHEVIKGFNPIYGSHHKFYGMMDFFYVMTYLNGFTPGLQNLYVGGDYAPIDKMNLKLRYHYLAMATKLAGIDQTLGHDVDFEASYQFAKDARFSLGFSYMLGTESMEKLKRASKDNNLKWAWFSLLISPRIFTTKW